MADHSIDITILNTTIGVPASADGVMGIFVQATTVATTFVCGNAYLVTTTADLTTLGVTAVNNPAVFAQVTDYYEQAGVGSKLWIFPITDSTAYATYLATDTFNQIIRGTRIADPLNMVKVIGLCFKLPSAAQNATDFPADVTDSIPLLKAALVSLFSEGYHVCGVIDGYNMKSGIRTEGLSTLGTMATKGAYNVGVCITGKGNGVSAVGNFLGKLSRISVGTSVGKVADGSLVPQTMYLTDNITTTLATKVDTLTPTEISTLGSKQFIFARTWLGKSGIFWNDGATAEDVAKAFSNIEYNRIANKLSDEALSFWTEEVGRNIPVKTNGDADDGYLGNKNQAFKSTYINPLVISNDITNASMEATGVGYSSSKKITFSLKILPAPALSDVEGTVEFVTTL
jgi:hypothetical protein